MTDAAQSGNKDTTVIRPHPEPAVSGDGEACAA